MNSSQTNGFPGSMNPEMNGHPGMMPNRFGNGYPPVEEPVQWMPLPSVSNMTAGLAYLSKVDQLLIKQKVNLFEMFTGFEMRNKYSIKNSLGQQVFHCEEESDSCERICCTKDRAFIMHVMDNRGEEVILIRRKYKCSFVGQFCSCSECCKDVVNIEAPPGVHVGSVKQVYNGCDISYKIRDTAGNIVLTIKGPNMCKCYCPGDDIPFSLMSADGCHQIGQIQKQWGNFFKEWFTTADNFGILFPMDLDVNIKAVILGAVILIDFMYFENQKRGY